MSAAYRCFASCAFGLEAVMARELKDLRFNDIAARDARVYFLADEAGIARANLWLRTADRVYIELAVFPAVTFDELFEGVRALRWSDYIPKDAAFVVNADSAHSRVDIRVFRADVRDFSRSDCLVLANPPYAQRLGEREVVHRLYADMGRALAGVGRKCIITADESFERYFGARATKRRKLYNGNIRCTLYQYYR
jgi:23S rRNA G2445 N2-methylase RlmL